jgi:hypothetical protein
MSYTFAGVNEGGFGGYTITDQLLYNLKWFVEWGLLNAGAYSTTLITDEESDLKVVNDERYPEGTVWTGAGREWVWESGISAGAGYVDPFRVSGIYINGDFHPVGEESLFSYHVDYQHGRIIFDNPQNPLDTIQAEYCWKTAQVDFADHADFRKLMQDAIKHFNEETEPSTDPIREHQVWLPAIFLHDRSGTSRGLELGGGQIKTRIITAHIFAEQPYERNLIADMLDKQNRKTLIIADLNNITFPFDSYGDIVAGTTNWPTMAAAHPWKKIRFEGGDIQRLESLNPKIFRSQVSWEIDIDIGGI